MHASEPSVAPERQPRRKLLAVSPVPLWPDTNGYSLRVVNLLRWLARDWEVHLVAAISDRKGDRTETLDVHSYHPVSTRGNVATMPWELDLEQLFRAARSAARDESFAAALIWSGAEELAAALQIPTVVGDRIDCATLAAIRDAQAGRGIRGRLPYIGAAVQAARYERRIVRMLTSTVVVSPADARALGRVSGRDSVFVIPNGVALRQTPDPMLESTRPVVVFTGALGFRPNLAAAEFFATRVMPRVREVVPDARFVVAGWGEETEGALLEDLPGVVVQRNVPDLSDAVLPAWVSVAPMLSGCGIKNKVLDAWACGKPVVMSSLAAQGLSEESRGAAIVADGAEAMASGVARLLKEPQERSRLAQAGYDLVSSQYAWPKVAARLTNLIDEQAAHAGSSPRTLARYRQGERT